MQSISKFLVACGCICSIFYLSQPCAYWDLAIPHGDGESIRRDAEHEKEQREIKREAEELIREIGRKQWRAEQDQWERDNWHGNDNGYEGTCGPPDRDR